MIFISITVVVMCDVTSATHTFTLGSPKPRLHRKHIYFSRFLQLKAANAIMPECLSVRLWGALCTTQYYPHHNTLPNWTHSATLRHCARENHWLCLRLHSAVLKEPNTVFSHILSNEDSAKSAARQSNPSESKVSLRLERTGIFTVRFKQRGQQNTTIMLFHQKRAKW